MKQNKPRSIAGLCFILVGVLLIGGAGGWHLYNQSQESRAQENATAVLTTIQESFHQKTPEEEPQEVVQEEVIVTPLFQEETSPLAEMPVLVVDGTAYVGALELPTLGLELPVIQTCSDHNLKLAPCLYAGSVYSNDMVIAGHNYVSHFAHLNQLKEGDEIHFLDMDQKVYAYTVAGMEMIQPTDPEEMVAPGGWDLSLFTCTPDGKSRLTVRCTAKTK